MSEGMKLEIPGDSLQKIIGAHVQTAVMEALLPHKEDLVRKLVETALLKPCKDDAYRYANDRDKPTELEHMVRVIIAEEAQKGIRAWAESHRAEIAEKIRKAMTTKSWGAKMAANIADQMATADHYRFDLKVTPIVNER